MVRATRFSILLLLALWLSACAESGKDALRPHFADGETATGGDSTLQNSNGFMCAAAAESGTVQSGVAFNVRVMFSGGTAPYTIVGVDTGLDASGTTISGSITNTSGSLQQVSRRIPVADSAGHTASCNVMVIVQP